MTFNLLAIAIDRRTGHGRHAQNRFTWREISSGTIPEVARGQDKAVISKPGQARKQSRCWQARQELRLNATTEPGHFTS